jgi:hypothetical protein
MPLIIRMVGKYHDRQYQFLINGQIKMSVNMFIKDFTSGPTSLTEQDFKDVKFILNKTKAITDYDEEILIDEHQETLIMVFTSSEEIRNKLFDIFIKFGMEYIPDSNTNKSSELSINKPITINKVDAVDEVDVMTDEVIEKLNEQTLKLFDDEDFRHLIKIYMEKPDLFNSLAKYVQHGNVVETKETLSYDELSDDKKTYYDEQFIKMKKLELNIDDDIIMKSLIQFSGHLNLTLRALLQGQV